MYPFVKIKYGATIQKCKENRQRLIISNHQTAYDQFFVGYGYAAPIYYVASEDLFSNGLSSKLIRYAVNAIPIKKQATDVKAVMNCMRVAKEGGTIALFPEGNRTFSGATEYISPAIVKLVKALKLPLTFFRIEGGYGVQPRWSDKVRKGKIKAYTSKTVEPEEYLKMTDGELYGLILKELYVDERDITESYKGKRLAEYLERAVYVCPSCGITHFVSDKNLIKCTSCGLSAEYLPNKTLKGVGKEFPFKNVKDWYDYQTAFVNKLDPDEFLAVPVFCDRADVYAVELYKSKTLIEQNAELVCFGDRLIMGGKELRFSEASAITVLGRNKLNIYYKDKLYQIKGYKRFNAVKYVNIYSRYKNYLKGEENVKFLGL